jgi:hypothetical protein
MILTTASPSAPTVRSNIGSSSPRKGIGNWWKGPAMLIMISPYRAVDLENFNVDAGGQNEIFLIVWNEIGYWFLNGEFISELDVSAISQSRRGRRFSPPSILIMKSRVEPPAMKISPSGRCHDASFALKPA